MPEVRLIAAIDDNRGIAKNGRLPWYLPTDRRYFRDHVQKGPVVMGWGEFASNKFRPHGEGPNTVLTRRDTEAIPGVWIAHDAKEFFEKNDKDIWVAGGGQIFAEALPYATHLYVTRVKGDFGSDTFFPEFERQFKLEKAEPWQTENGTEFRYELWSR